MPNPFSCNPTQGEIVPANGTEVHVAATQGGAGAINEPDSSFSGTTNGAGLPLLTVQAGSSTLNGFATLQNQGATMSGTFIGGSSYSAIKNPG